VSADSAAYTPRVLRAVPALVFVLLLAGCGGGGDKSAGTTTVERTVTATTNPTGTASETTPSVTTHGRYHYPDAVIENYMKSCMAGDAKKEAYCGCTLDKLSNDVSVRDFAEVGLSGGKLPPRINRLIRNAALDCVDKL
jgi:hypothetical protein